MNRKNFGLGIVFLSVFGCSPYSADNYCTTSAKDVCAFHYKCCNGAEREELMDNYVFLSFANYDECVEKMDTLCRQGTQAENDAVHSGRAEWDTQKVENCATNMSEGAQECNAEKFFGESGEDCRTSNYLGGKVKNGETCFKDYECEGSGASCKRNTSEEEDEVLTTFAGKCVPGAKKAEACGESSEDGLKCEDGLICSGKMDDETFEFSYECSDLLENGENCIDDSYCLSGHCDADDSGECVSEAPENDDAKVVYEMCTGDTGSNIPLPIDL